MRGRKPDALYLNANDIPQLRQTARSQSLPWYQVRRARIVLAIAEGQRVQQVAAQMQCATRTVRRTCCRYQDGGLHQLLAGPQRPGRSLRIPPPATGPNRPTGLPGTGSQGVAHHALVES
jgi:hypothetical protein